MPYTVEELLAQYDLLPADQWIVARNHDPSENISKMVVPREMDEVPKEILDKAKKLPGVSDKSISAGVLMHRMVIPRSSDGTWTIHISIDPADIEKAIWILHNLFEAEETPAMCMGIESKASLAGEHESGKEVTLVFDRAVETSKKGREAILFFLWSLAVQFEKENIKPEAKPPLAPETHGEILIDKQGRLLEKVNIELTKFESPIQVKKGSPSIFITTML